MKPEILIVRYDPLKGEPIRKILERETDQTTEHHLVAKISRLREGQLVKEEIVPNWPDTDDEEITTPFWYRIADLAEELESAGASVKIERRIAV